MLLDIKFPPRVRLQWGANIAEDDIAAGQDVYLECLSQANPPVSRLVWLQNNYRVEPSKSDSVVISGHSLVIQSVAPRHSGNYSCVSSNSQGDAVSQSLQLRVKFRPVCSQSDLQTVFLPLNVQAEVLCQVTAHPPPSFWWWTFNNSHHLHQVTPISSSPSDKYPGFALLGWLPCIMLLTPAPIKDYLHAWKPPLIGPT